MIMVKGRRSILPNLKINIGELTIEYLFEISIALLINLMYCDHNGVASVVAKYLGDDAPFLPEGRESPTQTRFHPETNTYVAALIEGQRKVSKARLEP